MWNYLLRRLAWSVPTIGVVLVLTFFLVRLSGDPLDELLGPKGGSPAERARLAHQLGLDRPLHRQFLDYFVRLGRGDLGSIPSAGAFSSVAEEIRTRLPKTFALAVSAMLLATLVGVGSGLVQARMPDTWLDRALRAATFLLISSPVFYFGILLIFLFAYLLGILPASATGDTPLAFYLLPVATLGLRPAAFISRVTRSTVLDELGRQYVLTARAKGLSGIAVLLRHVLRNASLPLVTIIGGDLGSLMGGTMITETVFSFRGLGQFAVEAVRNRWFDAVMAVALVWAVIFVLVNLVVDLCYARLDPRVNFGRTGQ